ncbi:MAG: T9SS type A sorting domain-containing protein [Bacteroidia bacterium]|nr:T9SS type A sorting domain-containing protein [Bacteroidia bacterium]
MKSILIITALFLVSFSTAMSQSATARYSAENTATDVISIGWYPNPVSVGEKIKVDVELAESRELKTELLDALGRKVFHLNTSYPPGKSRIYIYTNEVKPGLYFVRISTESGSRTEKVIIK